MNINNTRTFHYYKITNNKLGDVGIKMTRKLITEINSDVRRYYLLVEGIQHFYNWLHNDHNHERDYEHNDYKTELIRTYEFEKNDDEKINDMNYDLAFEILNNLERDVIDNHRGSEQQKDDVLLSQGKVHCKLCSSTYSKYDYKRHKNTTKHHNMEWTYDRFLHRDDKDDDE